MRNVAQENADHARLHPLVAPGTGEVEQYSVISFDYEPNRPMAPDPNSIIAKKGYRPAKEDTYKDVDVPDKIVGVAVLVCLSLMIIVIGITLIKLG